MVLSTEDTRPVWFVSAGTGRNDQSARFVREGIWESVYGTSNEEKILSIMPGDRIAIKHTSVSADRERLPFDNRGLPVSTMEIKAVGTVVANMGDGRTLKVEWTPVDPPKVWCFYTGIDTLWDVVPGDWHSDRLIDFAFENKIQNIDEYLAISYWGERYGEPIGDSSDQSFTVESATAGLGAAPPNALRYAIDDILAEGCFLDQSVLERMLERLETKQNVILQGPPGAGKTWLSKRLAYALIGFRDDSKIRQMQFHPNLSYEDFVRGYRPQGDGNGTLSLADGPFLQLCDTARRDQAGKYVMVIEEINRGNPASIFGELLTLLEADKRTPNDALALAYSRDEYERFHIPPNVYVIGTMNLADRSLALVDIALRRRFAFFDLEPAFNETWLGWVRGRFSEEAGFVGTIKQRIDALNSEIARDSNLGDQFRVGHSHFTPASDAIISDPIEWYKDVVETEIAPLLREYWFDNRGRADEEIEKLTAGL